ncbi:MAG: 16S rRNA (cytosine(1402)-N(4))-methyltransferase RsmH, partial [Oscillospiraceae bacterium]|nr:16S rRNA (cytosine(1402)-N(4))-methyltransferase RsmH [Oscillospiraceae bacterium]
GGHSERIAERLQGGRLVGVDRDSTAIKESGERLERFGERVTLVKGNFRDIGAILDSLGIKEVNGMLFDLGVSSPQLDDGERGFSYMTEAPLDMRMDRDASLTAFDVVNGWPEEELRRILFEYGEERYSARIASGIVSAREKAPIRTTLELVEIIKKNMPAAALREKQHPAKRTFQAVRIAVNDELNSLSEMLGAAMDRLSSGGRLCVISFHSLEDRIVKNAIRARENGCTCPPESPICVCGFVKTVRSVTKKPITPSEAELENNPRARSAKLRIAEKL